MPLCMFSLMRLSLFSDAPGGSTTLLFFYFAIDVPSSLPLLHFFDHADTLKVVLVLTNTALCVYVIKKW